MNSKANKCTELPRVQSYPMATQERDMCCAAECRKCESTIQCTYVHLDSVRNVLLKHESAVNTTMLCHVSLNTLDRI